MSLKTCAWTFCQGWHIKVESIYRLEREREREGENIHYHGTTSVSYINLSRLGKITQQVEKRRERGIKGEKVTHTMYTCICMYVVYTSVHVHDVQAWDCDIDFTLYIIV